MPIDWSGVALNANGWPLGYIVLTPEVAPGLPLYVKADSITSVQPADGPNTAITYGLSRVVVKENLRVVFRLKDEANTMKTVEDKASVAPVSLPESSGVPLNGTAVVPVRRKAR